MQQSNSAGVPGRLGRVLGRPAAAVATSVVSLVLVACAGEVSGTGMDDWDAPAATHPIGPLDPPSSAASPSSTAGGGAGPMTGVPMGGATAASGGSGATSTGTGAMPPWSAQPPAADTSAGNGSMGGAAGKLDTSGDSTMTATTGFARPDAGVGMTGETSSAESTSGTSTDTVTSTTTDAPTSTDATPTGEVMVSEFDIELQFVDTVSDLVNEAFTRAAERWESVIVGDLQDIPNTQVQCGPDYVLEGPIDDLLIVVDVKPIDGPQRILGAAAPCAARRTDGLPLAGLMQFDEVDLEEFAQRGRLEEIVLHEMGHVLGVGSLWPSRGLLRDQSPGDNENVDTWFAGEAAIEAFDEVGGDQYSGAKVPVENIGGEGTANGHWRDAVLGTELMTSFMSGQRGELSIVTIASLRDLGYQVDMSQADDYSWPPALRLLALTDEEFEPIHYGDDILDIDLEWVD